MEKFDQIQTYVRYIDEENFQRVLQDYKKLLLHIGFSKCDVENWISGINRSVEEYGVDIIKTNILSKNLVLEMDQHKINVTVSILIWTNESNKYLNEPWIEILLLINQEENINTQYEKQYETIIWGIMEIFSVNFQETGVFATNEMNDGEAFIGFAANLKEKLWAFNRAIIPSHHHLLYQNTSGKVSSYSVSQGLGFRSKTFKD